MTDWLSWLLEELEEDEDQGEELDLSTHVLTGREAEKAGEVPEEKRGPTGAVGRAAATSTDEAAEERGHPVEERAEWGIGQGEDEEFPPVIRKLSRVRPARAARQAGVDQPWQAGTPAGTEEMRPTANGGRTAPLLPDIGETAHGTAPAGAELYTAVRRTRAAAEQAQGLRQPGPVVIREPVAVGGQGPTPAELDRIFQRDARRYDGGFTLF